MTILQELRLWIRKAPLGERIGGLVAVALVLSVVGWLLVPATSSHHSVNVGAGIVGGQGLSSTGSGGQTNTPNGSASVSTQGQSATGGGSGGVGSSGGTGAGGSTSAGGAASNPGTGSAANTAGGTSGGRCASPSGSDQGLTATQMNVAVILINLVGPSTNAATGVPTVQQQQQNFNEVIGSVNSSGGVACRKVVPTYYSPDIADQNQVEQACLQVVQSKPFAVIDEGAFSFFPALASCIAQAQLPDFSGLPLPQSTQAQFYPYWFSLEGVADVIYRNSVFALNQRGFFSHAQGFTKLGILYRDCEPQYYPEVVNWLHQVGLTSSEIVPYDTGCPTSAVAPPNDNEQAILTFEQHQVSNVMFVDGTSNFVSWSQIAGQQGFHPKYGFPDDGEVAISSGSAGGSDDWQNLNGAIAIEVGRYGEPKTPGLTPTPGTAACNAIYAKYGQPPVWQRQDDGLGGVPCDDLWFLQSAADHAPVLQRNALAAGLAATKTLDLSYPEGPANFTGYHATGGGEYWRVVEAYASCSCWRVVDQTFHPSFP